MTLATPRVSPKKDIDAIMAKALYKNIRPENEIALNSESIFDGMMLVQKVKD